MDLLQPGSPLAWADSTCALCLACATLHARPLRPAVMELVENYLRELASRRASPHTVRAYRRDLHEFVAVTSCTPETVEPDHVVTFLAALRTRRCAPKTIHRAASSVRSFLRWAHLRRGVRHVVVPRVALKGLRLPTVLAEEQVRAMLAVWNHRGGWIGCRNRALLEVLYSSGCRSAELLAMNRGDLKLDRGVAVVHGKGGKDRLIAIGRHARKALRDYLDVARPSVRTEDDPRAVWLSSRGRRLGDRQLRKLIDRTAKLAQIRQPVGPHTFRHSAATHLIEHDAPLLAVRDFLGHASVATTQIYTHLSTRRMLDVHSKSHPRA